MPFEPGAVESGLAGLAHVLGSETPPAGASAAFDRALLDHLAVIVAGLGDSACARAADAFGGLSSTSTDPPAIAFAQGACAHWFDWDDTHDESHVHGGAVVFPTLLALWKAGRVTPDRRTPRHFVAAAVAGYELACRIGGPLREHAHRGWMPTGSGATLGAAAAGAFLCGAGPPGIRSAMGIAAANAALSRQALADRVNAKGALAGIAARTAVESVFMAASGIEGPSRFLSGSYGMGALQAPQAAELWKDVLRQRPKRYIEEVSLKPYPCCRSAHGVIDAVLQFRMLAPDLADKVTAVRVSAPPGVVERCGSPFSMGDNPRLAAQFSIPYTAAVALRRGRLRLDDFSPAAIESAARAMRPLIDAIVVTRSQIAEDVLAPVSVAFSGTGGVLDKRTVETLRGDAASPLSPEEQHEKVRIAAEGVLPDASFDEAVLATRAAGTEGPEALLRFLDSAAARRGRRR